MEPFSEDVQNRLNCLPDSLLMERSEQTLFIIRAVRRSCLPSGREFLLFGFPEIHPFTRGARRQVAPEFSTCRVNIVFA